MGRRFNCTASSRHLTGAFLESFLFLIFFWGIWTSFSAFSLLLWSATPCSGLRFAFGVWFGGLSCSTEEMDSASGDVGGSLGARAFSKVELGSASCDFRIFRLRVFRLASTRTFILLNPEAYKGFSVIITSQVAKCYNAPSFKLYVVNVLNGRYVFFLKKPYAIAAPLLRDCIFASFVCAICGGGLSYL